jgi:hypothetical protein
MNVRPGVCIVNAGVHSPAFHNVFRAMPRVWERINILAYMLWVVVFAILLLRPHRFVSRFPRSARLDGASEFHDFAAPQHAHADAVPSP